MCVRGRTYNTKSYGFDDNIRITPFTQKDARGWVGGWVIEEYNPLPLSFPHWCRREARDEKSYCNDRPLNFFLRLPGNISHSLNVPMRPHFSIPNSDPPHHNEEYIH